MMFFKRLLARRTAPVEALYEQIVAAARQPVFYRDWLVPDNVNGRFDMIVLHVFLVLGRLRGQGKEADDMAQKLTDAFFLDMDRSLREMGVGDLSVGKKVRKMAEACYGRFAAYEAAMAEGKDALQQALARNIFAGVDQQGAGPLADWANAAKTLLARQDTKVILQGRVEFP